ncbi:4-hydroxybenzoate polyprenyltransferase [Nonomuraea solani]|uniref:4-hydroxybenzoate polyprenyltransferase n=1 Tax=Nonomuraea solani TaxID=1144553 RepID=A0A1H6E3T9_9ACTN|nr:UbiA family prenyltransferase [Nonomuraea solani]SEG91913.1 4-hydroxybenzoate polyprenyltransferase [Nonomuraea solani]
MNRAPLRDLLELVRAPAALSVPGDVVAGAAAGRALGRRTAGLACSSVCLYWAGMAANDWADRRLDAVERPERPIPSGRVSPGAALAVAAGLTAAGVAAAALTGGRRALAVAVPLAAAVWTYDLVAKNTRAGPLVMALCRGLDVLLGATPGRSLAGALPAAFTITVHTYLLTVLSRGEVSGTGRGRPATTLTGTLALATATAARPVTGERGPDAVRAALALWYAAQFGSSQADAVADPSPARVRAAVTAGIVSLPALQGALTARAGAPRTGLALAAAVPLARRLARKLSPT